ncbi:MAG: TniQ family protein [Microcystaceae cyanobacterium]
MMSVEDLTIYEGWDLKKPEIPPRSRLFSLKPIGIGTSYVESLTSYLIRLSELHCLSVRNLIAHVIVPIVPKSYHTTNLFCMRNYTGAVNGTGELAQDLVQALEKLTYRPNLTHLTLLNWQSILTHRKLLRKTKAWCPHCYEEWRLGHQTVYDPLIWHFKSISICLHHQRALQTVCPHCHQKIPLLSSLSRAGYCSKCSQWLGISSNTNKIKPSDLSKAHYQIVGDFLASTPYLSHQVNRETIAQSFEYYCSQMTQGNIAAMSRFLKIPKNKVWMWQQGQVLPQFEVLLNICHQLQVSLVDFLQRKPLNPVLQQDNFVLSNLLHSSPPKSSDKTFNPDSIRQRLEAFLNDKTATPIPMTEMAKRLGHNKRVIHRHFPELCRSISARYLKYKQELRSQRIATACEQVQQVVQQIHAEGKYPTEALVSQFLEKPGIFRDREVREAFHQARRSLGFEP